MRLSPADSPDRPSRAGISPAAELEAAIADGDYKRALELAEAGVKCSSESRDTAFERECDAYNRVLAAEWDGAELHRSDPEAWEVSPFADVEDAAREEHEAWQSVRCSLDADPRAFAPIDSRGLRERRFDRARWAWHPRRLALSPGRRPIAVRLPTRRASASGRRRRVSRGGRRARAPGRRTDGDPEPALARHRVRAGRASRESVHRGGDAPRSSRAAPVERGRFPRARACGVEVGPERFVSRTGSLTGLSGSGG